MTQTAFSTGSRHGDARAPGALARLLRAKKLPDTFACGDQVHGTRVVIVPALFRATKFPKSDGFLTDRARQPVAIFTADCVPVFLDADAGRVVGIVHAGWRGVRQGILARAVRLLRKKWRIPASRVRAWAGPHIGPCCFEVQWDVAKHFPNSRRRSGDRWTVDLASELHRQARRLGVRWEDKKAFRGCTMHQSRFYSYRRNKTSKRQVSVMMKRGPL